MSISSTFQSFNQRRLVRMFNLFMEQIKCHQEPEYQCRTCRRKFHSKTKYNKHCVGCENKMYSCKICGKTFKQLYSVKKHTKRCHPDESTLENIQIVQDQKQDQNIDLKMEITVEETTISAGDDQGSVNPSSKTDASTLRSDEHSLAYLNDDETMDSRVIDKESQTVDDASLNCSSKTQAVTVEISQSLGENISNQTYFCNICGITMHKYSQFKYHRATKHKEGRHQCPACSRKFHYKSRLEEHVSRCARLKHSCELCGQKFNLQSKVEDHKKRVHHGNKPLRDANIEGADCTEEKRLDNVEIDAAEEMTSCIVCRISFASPYELMKHKIKCYQEPEYECLTCGRKFHSKMKYNKHCAGCGNKTYSCKICGRTYKQLYSVKKHTKRCHPDESSLENIQIVQDQKQDQNIDLKMEITVEETMISARDDQGLSSVNSSSKTDASTPQSDEHSLAYLNDDETMDSRVIDKESKMVDDASSNCSSKRQAVTVEISKPLGGNLFKQPYFCNICGITMRRYSQFKYHRATKHKEGQHQCPNCSRKFHFKIRLEEHVSRCARLKHSCELCGQKFNFQRKVEDHKKRVHHGSKPLKDTNIEGADCTEEKKQNSEEKIDAAEEMTSCIVCRISFASPDKLMKHKLNCSKHSKEHDDSQSSSEDISLLHGVSEAQADSTIVPLGDNIEIKLEIEVEETMLQEQEYQVPNENPEKSSVTTLHPYGDKSMKVESEDAYDLENGIKVKEECLEDEEETIAELSNQKTGAEVIGPANLIDLGYVPVKSCSFKHAKLFIKNFEFGFGFHLERIIKKGSMRHYRCLRIKQTARPQCERKVLMFTPNVIEKSTVFVKGEHSCINAPPENMTQIDFGYVPVKTCSIEDAKSFVKNFEFGFGLQSKRFSKRGNMRYYRCLRFKQSVRPQCERKVLICTLNANEESTVCAKGEHSCINAPPENLTNAQIDFGYAPVKTCSIDDAESFVKNFEFGFGFRKDKIAKKGRMQYYACSRLKQTTRPQCERRVFICTPHTNEESTVYAKGEHSCMNAPPEDLTRAQIDFGYAPVKTCSFEDAKSFVKNFEFGFAYRVGNGREKGNIRYYRCQRVKQRIQQQCKRRVLIFTPSKNEESTVCAKGEHSCINAPPENLVCVKAKPLARS